MNADHIYKAVKEVFDTSKPIYEEYIIYLIGFEGLIENDGTINGRRSYILCDPKE